MELHKQLNGKDVSLMDLIKLWVGLSFPIICCINTKDICTDKNWKSCILRKIMKETWEVLDMHERDKLVNLDLMGDEKG